MVIGLDLERTYYVSLLDSVPSCFPDLVRPVRGLECAAAGWEGRERGGKETTLWSGQKLSAPGGGGIPELRRRDSWPR